MALQKMTITEEDLLRSKIVTPGWYKAVVKDINQEQAADGQSLNTIVDIIVTEDGEFKGVPLKRYFSEKAPGFSVTFFEACGAKIAAGSSYAWEPCKGKTLQVYVINGEYRGRKTNVAEDFRPV